MQCDFSGRQEKKLFFGEESKAVSFREHFCSLLLISALRCVDRPCSCVCGAEFAFSVFVDATEEAQKFIFLLADLLLFKSAPLILFVAFGQRAPPPPGALRCGVV